MKKFLVSAILLATSSAALADHHGRGMEQVNGFPGMYDLGIGVATFTGDDYLVIVSKNSRAPITILTYVVDDGVLTIKDVSPPTFVSAEDKACQLANSGTYKIVDIEAGFTLETIEDPCARRAGLMTRFTYSDYVRPTQD